jgi:hypothetical protein
VHAAGYFGGQSVPVHQLPCITGASGLLCDSNTACSSVPLAIELRHQFIRRSIDCEGWRKSGPSIPRIPWSPGPEVSGMVRLEPRARDPPLVKVLDSHQSGEPGRVLT